MRLLRKLGKLLFPPKCILCRSLLQADELDLCRQCRGDAPDCTVTKGKLPFLKSWLAVWHYEDRVRSSILRYKFYNYRHYAKGYGRLLAMKLLRQRDGEYDLITWVPISRLRKLRRGYDQVKLLSDAVCRELDAQSLQCLRKIRNNPPQSTMRGAAERRANVLGVYEAVEPERFQGKRVLILDDVITTGATLSECAKVLLIAGAKEVHCAAVATARHNK